MNEKIVVKKLRVKFKDIINYTYIIINKNSKKCIIVDPSWQLETIINLIEHENLQVNSIFLTHSHHDHVNLVDDLVNIYNCFVYISEIEKNYYNFQSKNLILLKDNEIIKFDEIIIRVLITPGHTKGSTCYCIDNKILFTGDTLFSEGCGNSTQLGGDCSEMFNSIQRLKRTIDDECIIYPGHAFKEEVGQKFSKIKKNNIYLQIISEDIFIKLNEMKSNKNVNYI